MFIFIWRPFTAGEFVEGNETTLNITGSPSTFQGMFEDLSVPTPTHQPASWQRRVPASFPRCRVQRSWRCLACIDRRRPKDSYSGISGKTPLQIAGSLCRIAKSFQGDIFLHFMAHHSIRMVQASLQTATVILIRFELLMDIGFIQILRKDLSGMDFYLSGRPCPVVERSLPGY